MPFSDPSRNCFSFGITTQGRWINNAGDRFTDHLAEMTLKHWQWLIQLNLNQRVPGLSSRFARILRQYRKVA